MFLVKVSIRQSAIHGLGCFAEEDIKKGQLVWQFDPRMDLQFTEEDITQLPPPAVDFLHRYGYCENRQQGRVIILCGDFGRHLNHAEDFNLLEAGAAKEFNIAARDIRKGEELTCNYYDFDDDVVRKLGR